MSSRSDHSGRHYRSWGAWFGSSTVINAALCGHFDAPVVLVTGDDALEEEARSTLGEDVECAVTKYALDRWTARCVALERSREAIKSQASRALSRLDGFAPHTLEGPVTLEVEFTSTSEDR